MKPLLAVVTALFVAGCAADSPSAAEVHDQFQNDFPTNRSQFVPAGNPENPNADSRFGSPSPH